MTSIISKLKLNLITIPGHRIKWLFSEEKKLINSNGHLIKESENPSVFVFSTHKCASTFLNRLINNLASYENKKHIDLETYLATQPKYRDELYANDEFTQNLLQNTGCYFGVFRYPFSNFPKTSSAKIVLVLRDPRDILTSQFFSIAYSHPILTAKFLKKRENALKIGIDKHVLEMVPRFLKTYNDYIDKLSKRDDFLLIRYEDLISDFSRVLNKLLDFVNHSEKEKVLNYWKNNHPFVIDKEDSLKHKRKVLPGDHKVKLQPETIKQLDFHFKEILLFLGYK